MAGVSSNLYRENRRSRWTFLGGLTLGSLLAALLLATMAYILGRALEAVVPETARVAALAAGVGALAVADLLGRTPHVWRQVPQALVRMLPSGRLGLVWGFDMGLLFTTQKVVSLGWAALLAVVLLWPSWAPVLLLVMAATASAGVIAATAAGGVGVVTIGRRKDTIMLRALRVASGSVLLGATAVTALA
jgi:hypothetical protein